MTNRNLFLLLNLLVVIGLLALIFRSRNRKGPSQLNLRAKAQDSFQTGAMQNVEPKAVQKPAAREKSLNVIFMYNGEPWDAHEVLGIPAGSAIEIAQKAFEDQRNKMDCKEEAQLQFFKAALDAIMISKK